jgi:putative protease
MLELLSPAGSPESVIAAVQNGADAVYMGFPAFNARRGAKNLAEEEFADSVRYCRVRGCKVYVTLNTLVSDRELPECVSLARRASRLGADAVIVQDLGLARVLRRVLPDMPLHASTQMGIHNLDGARAAAELGIRRVILARELPLRQIAHIAKNAPVETEVFVHGALCFSYSGQCYMSALIGRRSGNRGMCAQPCRLPYSLGGRYDDYPLSLRDNCLVSHLAALEEAGVKCVKLEGRMRRPEYTAVATAVYSKAIRDKKAPTEAEMNRLELAFSRQGFTDGYLTGNTDAGMFGVREEPNKDTEKLFSQIRRGYANSELRRVNVDFFAVVQRGAASRFAAQDEDGNHVHVFGPVPEEAQQQALTEDMVYEQLYKTGGTPYLCRKTHISLDDGVYLSAASLNAVRRALLDSLTEKRAAPPERAESAFPAQPASVRAAQPPALLFQVSGTEQLTPELAALRPACVYVPLEVLCNDFGKLFPFLDSGAVPVAVMPRVIAGEEEEGMVQDLLHRASALGVRQALVGNLGHIRLARAAGMDLRGDFGLNAYNSFALQTLDDAGFLSATASFELRLAQVRDLSKPVNLELIAYGRLPVMVTEHCLIKNSAGRCTCLTPGQLSDRQGSVFPVVREFGCRNVIWNAHKLFLADKLPEFAGTGLWGLRLLFSTESPRECVDVAKSYLGQSRYRPNGLTRGLYFRGVE